MAATVADVRKLALALPETAERPCYGTPGFYVRKKLFARVKEDGRSIIVRMGFDERDAMLATAPEIFSVTPHYQDYPSVIVSLPAVTRAMLADLLADAWQRSAPASLTRSATPPSGRPASPGAPAGSKRRRPR